MFSFIGRGCGRMWRCGVWRELWVWDCRELAMSEVVESRLRSIRGVGSLL